MVVELVCVGTELLLGNIVNTNAAYLAQKEYGITDEDILNATCNHTTGRPGMSLLEKIIFVADYIEPGRKTAPNLGMIRKVSFEDIDVSICLIIRDTLKYLKESGGEIDPATAVTGKYYFDLKGVQ